MRADLSEVRRRDWQKRRELYGPRGHRLRHPGPAVVIQLNPPLPVQVTSRELPDGVKAKSRKGWCYGWEQPGIDSHRLWLVVLDETGEVVDVPQPEIRMDLNWSYGRRG